MLTYDALDDIMFRKAALSFHILPKVLVGGLVRWDDGLTL